ncbi:MAG TPA: GntR family transcriptional regulator [Polyangiaceae bacterium]|nr:GntR family transcriptional regulator [Polyangiaceae bacterium]
MPLHAVARRSLADQVSEQLADGILSGRYAIGSNLPPERQLSESFGVNRHVVREALQRLEQLGMIAISRASGARVLDVTREAGLELLATMAEYARDGADVARHWRATLEMRATIAADVARLCALRGDAEVKSDLLALAREMDATTDTQALFALEVRFWIRILDGAGNLPYRLAFNSLMKGVSALGSVAQHWSIEEIRKSGGRTPLAEAIAAGDVLKAEADTRKIARGTVAAFERVSGLASVEPRTPIGTSEAREPAPAVEAEAEPTQPRAERSAPHGAARPRPAKVPARRKTPRAR